MNLVTHEYDTRCPHCRKKTESLKPKSTWLPHLAIFRTFWRSKYRYDGTLWALAGLGLSALTLSSVIMWLYSPIAAYTTHSTFWVVAIFAIPLVVLPCLVYWIVQAFRKADRTHEEWVKSEKSA